MKNRLFAPVVLGAALIISGCGDGNPVSPGSPDLGPSLGKAGGTALTATIPLPFLGPPGCVSAIPNGSVHLTECINAGSFSSGDLTGTATVLFSGKQNTEGDGHGRGPIVLDVCHALGCGVFEGRFKGELAAAKFSGKFRAQGTSGSFVGRTMTATFEEIGPPPGTQVFTLTGSIN